MKAKIARALSLFVLIVCLFPMVRVQAEEVAPEQETAITNLQETDIILSEDRPMMETTFEINDYWEIDQALVNFDYRLTQLSVTDQSNLTFSVNGNNFYSTVMKQKEGKQHIQIEIPKEFLKVGKNTLKVESYVLTNEKSTKTPADWLFAYQSSNVGVIYENKENEPAIRAFHDRFSGEDNITDKNVAILVPDKANGKELQAATTILSGYKKIGQKNSEIIPINQWSNEEYRQKPYVIVVAEYDHLSADYQKLIDRKKVMNDGLLKVITNNQQQVLIVTSENEQALEAAGKFVANSELMSQVDESEKVVSENTEVDTLPIRSEQAIQFTKTGDQLQGEGRQQRDYFVQLPSNRSIAQNSQIYFEYRYSENLNFDHSLVTVFVNGIPIGSKKLSSAHAAGDELDFKMPKDLNVSGDFTVTVSFDLEMRNDVEGAEKSQAPWAYITGKSAMALLTNDRTELLFENYPFPFLKDGTYNQVGVVLPKEMNDDYYRSLSNVFNLLGTYTQDNTGEITYITDNEKVDSAVLQASNLIVIGGYQDNSVVQELNKHLYFKYNDKGTGFVSNEKIAVESGYGQRLGSGQLIASPYEKGKGVLVLTGAHSENIYLASKELSTSKGLASQTGDAFIVDKNNQISSFRFKKQANQGITQNLTETVKKNTSLISYIGLFLFVIAALIVLLVFSINKRRKKEGR
ncbi:cellulose biosynthesis cyclic di-GMP-binding regulatory protein BcsB [Enterococcus rivorum]|uniref:Cellulose synthase n=1 Tax=Enterococcus rivorum TaxID=762845 RepID=A0A1E5L0R7_9ENTE|nr:cellulose biosynthesis cyclic di-GMP-binding regulatory protein BcsB [Enterococcus rivorum]MBP2098463.1 hypothetical protein [Enterococcus rivorum]OEH83685.1 hypothetical protein BCR26_08440 [Enterococcus rivorum]